MFIYVNYQFVFKKLTKENMFCDYLKISVDSSLLRTGPIPPADYENKNKKKNNKIMVDMKEHNFVRLRHGRGADSGARPAGRTVARVLDVG